MKEKSNKPKYSAKQKKQIKQTKVAESKQVKSGKDSSKIAFASPNKQNSLQSTSSLK